jgi:hypothetical protein
MALLSERQQQAQNLARSIGQMEGAFVVNVMPLAAGAHLRVHVEQPHCQHVRGVIEGWGWRVVDCGNTSRFNVSDGTMRLTAVYEVQLDTERQEVQQDRTIPRDEVGKRKMDREVAATMEAIYGKKRR